ncbi:MAG TPA: nucleotide disphospho-sugar-binding domain-containing protein [Pyrinomonadaceae bacterium]|nr:nucleotide disphospho-sugar-binding domain-containing protein [Pyrinomonadaceae bacterium]
MSKRIILNTFGSFGDIHPYMAIAMELQRRGHKPVIATMEGYREKVKGIGVEFVPVRPHIAEPKQQGMELIEKIMEPKTGPRFLTEEVVFPAVRESYADLLPAVAGADLLVTHPAAPAGPLVGRKTGMPWISTLLAPLSFFSAYDPPMPPYWQWFTKLSVLGPGVMGFLLRLTMSTYKAKAVTAFRDELGIQDYGNPMFEGQHSPALILALFSRVFAQPQPDWPKQAEITGFCFYDGNHDAPVPPVLTHFLENGPPPIVFTLGSSAVWVARDFFQESIQAAKSLGRRAVLLIGDERNLPQSLPEGMIALDYAPYQSLLPKACAVVHHGGVGTTSQGLLAGVPTLIVPFAFDQADNAEHARKAGTSRTIYRNKYFAPRVAAELDALLTQPSYASRALAVSRELKQENGPSRAADLIEEVLAGKDDPKRLDASLECANLLAL